MSSKWIDILLVVVIVVTIGHSLFCDAAEPVIDDRFYDYEYKTGPWKFNANLLPRLKGMPETEALKLHPEGPMHLLTFDCPLQLRLGKRNVLIDRKIVYVDARIRSKDGTGHVGYVGLEYLVLELFVRDGRVIAYEVSHTVREDEDAPWRIGKYDTDGIPPSPKLEPGEVNARVYYLEQKESPDLSCNVDGL